MRVFYNTEDTSGFENTGLILYYKTGLRDIFGIFPNNEDNNLNCACLRVILVLFVVVLYIFVCKLF